MVIGSQQSFVCAACGRPKSSAGSTNPGWKTINMSATTLDHDTNIAQQSYVFRKYHLCQNCYLNAAPSFLLQERIISKIEEV